MKDVTLELTAAEALIALGAIQDKQLDASTLAAISTGEEREIADLSSRMLGRLATQIVDQLYPDQARIDRVAAFMDRHGGFDFDDGEAPPDMNREGDPAFNGSFR